MQAAVSIVSPPGTAGVWGRWVVQLRRACCGRGSGRGGGVGGARVSAASRVRSAQVTTAGPGGWVLGTRRPLFTARPLPSQFSLRLPRALAVNENIGWY